jgi:thiamine-monophosphate kinase
MQVKDVGEARLIEMLAKALDTDSAASPDRTDAVGVRLRLSIGDDAAAWDGPAGGRVLTTDTMVDGVHFNLEWISWADLGWKSVAANLSDIAAMGCAPLYSVITLGLRGDQAVEGLVEMYRGMSEVCRRYGGAIVGGDVVRSPVFFVGVAMVGVTPVPKEGEPSGQHILTRGAARVGDKIAVTGRLGCSAGGLRMMLQDLSFDEATASHLVNAHHRPAPRVAEGMLLAGHGVAAAIDVSDGLVDDLGKLCKASGVGARIHSDMVPADEFLRRAFARDWLSLALSGGEDYELLFTAPPQIMDVAESLLEVPVSVIGDVTDGPPDVTVLDEGGADIPIERGGWDHFRGP